MLLAAPTLAFASIDARMPLLSVHDFSELNLVHWRVEQGKPDPRNPLLEPEYPWDSGGVMAHGTVLRDPIDGKWKAWQISTPGEQALNGLEATHSSQRRLTYLESADGVSWTRPMMSLVKWPGHDRTNILLDLDSGGTSTYASVLVDAANGEWPYEMFLMRAPKFGPTPDKVGHLPAPRRNRASYRYRSRDGKAWELVEGPIQPAPGGDVCYVYRQTNGSYVSYFKGSIKPEEYDHPPGGAVVVPPPGHRLVPYDNNPDLIRTVSRGESSDGTNWSYIHDILAPDWRDPDDAQFIEIAPLAVPGGYIGFANAYHPAIQTMDLQVVASRDGISWWRPDRRPALPNPPLGEYGGGMIWQMREPVIEGDKLHVYYCGVQGLHGEILDTRYGPRVPTQGGETVIGTKTPTLPFNGALCRATFELDRLWALIPSAGGPTVGRAVTVDQPHIRDRQLELNVRTLLRGAVRVGLLDDEGRQVAGFGLEDCERVTGDHRRAVIRWKQGERAPTNAKRVVFELTNSLLYGFQFRP